MNYRDRTAEEILRAYWRGLRLIRALRWIGCAVCIVLIFKNSGAGSWRLPLLVLCYAGVLYGFRLWNSFRYLSLNNILGQDCDAVKFASVSQGIRERLGQKSSGMAALNTAWGLYWSGRFDEAAALLPDVDLRGKNPQGRLLLRNLDFNCRMVRNEVSAAEAIRRETAWAVEKMKPGSALRQQGTGLVDMMDAALALQAGDIDTFRAIRARIPVDPDRPFQRVTSAYQMAKADLAQGLTEEARANLTVAAERGNTLFVAAEARKLLAELDAGNAAFSS